MKSRDVSIPPEYLHTPARPDISYLELSHLSANFDLFDLLTLDQADGYKSALGLNSNLESSAITVTSEVNHAPVNRYDSALSTEINTTLPQADEGRGKTSCNRENLTSAASFLQGDSANAGFAAERQVKRRKNHSHGESILSEEFSEKQMAQLQDLAAKTATVQVGSTNPSRSLEFTILAAFAMIIGCSTSLAFLKKLLKGYRTNETSVRDNLGSDPSHMSSANRMLVINTLDRQIAFQGFLRTYHLYKLMSENRYGLQEIESPFLIQSLERPISPTMSKRGNPHQQQRARLCKLMMADIFPSLSEGHAEYDKKYREVLSMRKISHRLNQLVSHFSVGLFGLVPLEGTPEDQLIGLLNYS